MGPGSLRARPRRADPVATWFAGLVGGLGASAVLFATDRADVLTDLTVPLAFSFAMLAPVAWVGSAWRAADRGDRLTPGRLVIGASYPTVVAVLATWRGLAGHLGRTYGVRGLFDPLELALAADLGLPLLAVLGGWVLALVLAGAVVAVRDGGRLVGLGSTGSLVAPLLAVAVLRRRLGVPVEVTWAGVGSTVALVGFAVVWFLRPWVSSRSPAGGR